MSERRKPTRGRKTLASIGELLSRRTSDTQFLAPLFAGRFLCLKQISWRPAFDFEPKICYNPIIS